MSLVQDETKSQTGSSTRLPNFLIIGSAKSGTTALFEYLAQHPEAFLSEPKEPHFLAMEGQPLEFRGPGDDQMMNTKAITSFDRYQAIFAKTGGAKAVGEASVSTMYYPQSVAGIKKYMPGAKLICMLRQPADRAYSAYSFLHMRMFETVNSFAAGLEAEPQRIRDNWHHMWHYHRAGLYYDQLKPYFDAFDAKQIRVYIFEEFRKDPHAVLRDCFEFLEIDPTFVPLQEPSPHVSGIPKSKLLQTIYMRSIWLRSVIRSMVPISLKRRLQKRWNKMNLARVPLDPNLRASLTDRFRDDIAKLEKLLGRDLSIWLKGKS